jgi:hypothetical protein
MRRNTRQEKKASEMTHACNSTHKRLSAKNPDRQTGSTINRTLPSLDQVHPKSKPAADFSSLSINSAVV